VLGGVADQPGKRYQRCRSDDEQRDVVDVDDVLEDEDDGRQPE
jgi:hypothetical protein